MFGFRTQETYVYKDPYPNGFPLRSRLFDAFTASVIGFSATLPIDYVYNIYRKYWVQGNPNQKYIHKSIFKPMLRTLQSFSFFGMYRKTGLNLMIILPNSTLNLAFNDYWLYKLTSPRGEVDEVTECLAAIFAGVADALVVAPLSLYKVHIREHLLHNPHFFNKVHPTYLFLDLFRDIGRPKMYKLIEITFARNVLYCIAYFPLSRWMFQYEKEIMKNDEPSYRVRFVSGTFVAILATVFVAPMDAVKRYLTIIPVHTALRICPRPWLHEGSILETLRYVYYRHGFQHVYGSARCRLFMLSPINGLVEVIYAMEPARRLFKEKETEKLEDQPLK